jgi:hypothetical protein
LTIVTDATTGGSGETVNVVAWGPAIGHGSNDEPASQ